MIEQKNFGIVRVVAILNKMVKIFKDEMGLIMTYSIEFVNADDPDIVITILAPHLPGKYCAEMKVTTIANLLTDKNPTGVAEDLTSILLSEMINLISKKNF